MPDVRESLVQTVDRPIEDRELADLGRALHAAPSPTAVADIRGLLARLSTPVHVRRIVQGMEESTRVHLLRLLELAVERGLVCEVPTPGWRSGLFGVPMAELGELGRLLPDVAFIGAPYEGGVVTRPGTRLGPDYLRRHSRILFQYSEAGSWPEGMWDQRAGRAVLAGIRMVDVGDIRFPAPCSSKVAADLTQEAVQRCLAVGVIPALIGGDHSLSHAVASAVAARHRSVAYVYLDAHFDYAGEEPRRGTGVGLHHANHIDHTLLLPGVAAVVAVGCRQLMRRPRDLDERFHLLPVTAGPDEVAARIPPDCAVVLSVDVDVLDPAFMPATGALLPAGADVASVSALCEGIGRRRDVVAVDLVELQEHPEPGSALAATEIVLRMLNGVTTRKCPL